MSPAARVAAYRRQNGTEQLTGRQDRRHRRKAQRGLPTFDLGPVASPDPAADGAPHPGGGAGTGAAPAPTAATARGGGGAGRRRGGDQR